ncbi:MAG: pseudouridine synthase, partial [Deltaproteobacteria bacterium]|nr:pseudouridine synthase [Deltaproteobacteria bacterium]
MRADWTKHIRVVHLERELVVVEKPAGLSTVRHPDEWAQAQHPRQLPPTLAELIPAILKKMEGAKSSKGRPHPVRVVQRLDIGTSGLLVFARTLKAERGLGSQFRSHTVDRVYQALALGAIPSPLRLESLLVENRGDGLRGSHPSKGRRAVTHVKPLEALGGATLVECRLETGRTHQIRIHLAEAGHPLAGERVYNRPRSNRPPQIPPPVDFVDVPRIMLHAGRLGFRHPLSGELMTFEMDPPPDFSGFVEHLRHTTLPGENPPAEAQGSASTLQSKQPP